MDWKKEIINAVNIVMREVRGEKYERSNSAKILSGKGNM